MKNRKRSHSEQTDSKPEKDDDYKEPGTPKVQNEVKESRSSKLTKKPSDSHSQQELPKTSEPRIQKDSARKSPVEDQRKNVPADKPESRYEPREKERKPEKQRENPVYQSSRPRRDEHERGNKTTTTSTKDQRYSRHFESDWSKEWNSGRGSYDHKYDDTRLVNPPPREKQLKETIERTGTTARRINNQEFESSKLKEKDADFDRTSRAEKDSKKNAGASQPKNEKAPEPLAKEEKTPKSNQFPEQDFKPTKPI